MKLLSYNALLKTKQKNVERKRKNEKKTLHKRGAYIFIYIFYIHLYIYKYVYMYVMLIVEVFCLLLLF